jgi:hypothetical protein
MGSTAEVRNRISVRLEASSDMMIKTNIEILLKKIK